MVGIGERKWQIEYIKPLHEFNLENRFDFLKAIHYSNLRPLWHEEYIEKTKREVKNV